MRKIPTALVLVGAIASIASVAQAQRSPRAAIGIPVPQDATAIAPPKPVKTVAPGKILAIKKALPGTPTVSLTAECAIVAYGPHSNTLYYRTGEVRFKMTGSAPAGTTIAVYGSTGGGQVPFVNGTYTSAAGMDSSFVVGVVDSNFAPVLAILDLYGSQAISSAPGIYKWDWDAAPTLNECPVGNVPG